MAVVAQLVEHRIVIPVVAGSSPVDRPNSRLSGGKWPQSPQMNIPKLSNL